MKLDFAEVEAFRGIRILRQKSNLAYAYVTSHAAADADGAPNAYHPDDEHKDCIRDPHVGLDCLRNAGYRHTDWWRDVIVPDPDDEATGFVQPDGPTRGFFVAQTALRVSGASKYDPATYVDASRVPYVVRPTGFERLPLVGGPGDVGYATHLASGRAVAFIVGDTGGGSGAELGEGSLALFAALGFPDADPRTGGGLPPDPVQYIVFPESGKATATVWPRTNRNIADQVAQLLRSTPGISQ